jgi:hypothetical protein
MQPLQDQFQRIIEAIGRKKGRFALGKVPPEQQKQFRTNSPFALAVGDWAAIAIKGGGFVCMVGMTREHVEELRDLCNEALDSLKGTEAS